MGGPERRAKVARIIRLSKSILVGVGGGCGWKVQDTSYLPNGRKVLVILAIII